MSRLNAKQKRFAKEYLIDLNATRAYIAAGYSEKGAGQSAFTLLKNPEIQALIQAGQSRQEEKLDISGGRVLSELSKLAFANMLDYIRVKEGEAYVDLSTLTREQAAAIQEVTTESYVIDNESKDGEQAKVITKVKFKLSDKVRSLELLGRYHKLFIDRVELVGLEKLAEALTKARQRAKHAGSRIN